MAKKKKKQGKRESFIKRRLTHLYASLSSPASFSSALRLYKCARKDIRNLKLDDVVNFLKGINSYTRHRRVYVKFPRRKVITSGIDKQWQADLIDFNAYKKANFGYRYILVVIDVFSRKAWIKEMKKKTAHSTVEAFHYILKNLAVGRRPEKLQTDDGTEFIGAPFKRYLEKNNIVWFSTEMITKAQIAERFNRTLKNLIHQYMTHNNTNTFVDRLQDFAWVYNNRTHRSIGTAPNNVTVTNEKEIFEKQYGEYLREKKRFSTKASKFKVGETVRASKYRGKFDRGYTTNYRNELFRVIEVKETHPRTYSLETATNGEPIYGSFYGRELVAAS